MRFFQKAAWEVGSNTILINYMYIVFLKKRYIKNLVEFLSKAKWSEKIHRSTFQQIKYISIVFLWERKFGRSTAYSWEKKNGFEGFHHFIKKERLNNSSKICLNQWELMGFCKLQTKRMWGNFHDEIETC